MEKLDPVSYCRLRDSIAGGALKHQDAVMLAFAAEHAMTCPEFRKKYGWAMQDDLVAAVHQIVEA